MENYTIEVTARYDLVLTRVDMIVHEDNVFCTVDKEQYDRIKASYDTGKYKQMNDDPEIADLYKMFNDAGVAAENQKLLVDYPYVIINGMSFEEAWEIQNKEYTDAEIHALAVDFLNKDEKIRTSKTEAHDKRISGADPKAEDAKYIALAELQTWMKGKGYDAGEIDCPLKDEEGWVVETIDIGWPNGICDRKGYFKPFAVQFFQTTPELLSQARRRGFEVFESIEAFKNYIDNAPDDSLKNYFYPNWAWVRGNMKNKPIYVLAGTGQRREDFVEFLEKNGFECKTDEITSRESVIESIFPISIDIENKCYGHLHNKTCAAAAVSAGDTYTISQFYKLIELIT